MSASDDPVNLEDYFEWIDKDRNDFESLRDTLDDIEETVGDIRLALDRLEGRGEKLSPDSLDRELEIVRNQREQNDSLPDDASKQ